MTYRTYGALIAPLSVVVLVLAADPSFGGSSTLHRGSFASAHPGFHPAVGRSLRHHRRNHFGAVWPGTADFYEPPSGGPVDVVPPPPASSDVHYTYTYDV